MRSKVELTRKEITVLELIIKEQTTQQISKATKIPHGTVNGYRRKLRKKFGARSNVHLITLAILEYRFFKLLGTIEYQPFQITERDRDILFRILQGDSSQEVAAAFSISERSAEYTRKRFMLDTKSKGDVGLVRSCLKCGLLVVLPVRFNLVEYSMLGKTINTYKLRKSDVKGPIYTNHINQAGFVYFDFEHRFVYECKVSFSNDRKIADGITTALFLSGFTDTEILGHLACPNASLEEVVQSVKDDTHLISHEEFFFFYKTRGQLKPIITPVTVTDVFTAGQAILVDLIAQGKSHNEIYARIRSSKKYIDEHIKVILKMWSSSTILGVYMTFIHLNFIPRKKQ